MPPEIEDSWGGIVNSFDIQTERPFLVAVKAAARITGEEENL